MKIKYYGMSAFLITADNGTRIITDPYRPDNDALLFDLITEPADIVTISHEHDTHTNTDPIGGNPIIYRGPEPLTIKGIMFTGVPVYHDQENGKTYGNNTIIHYEIDDIKICHLGDLGHALSDEQIAQIGKVDILMIPVGITSTLTIELCGVVIDQLKPNVVIPMHFWHKPYPCPPPPPDFPVFEGMNFDPLFSDEIFLEAQKNVVRVKGSELEFKADSVPEGRLTISLRPALETDKKTQPA